MFKFIALVLVLSLTSFGCAVFIQGAGRDARTTQTSSGNDARDYSEAPSGASTPTQKVSEQ